MLKNFIFDIDRTLIDSYKPELETLKKALFIVTNKAYNDEVMNKLTILTTEEFFAQLGIDINSDTMKMINRHWERLLKEKRINFFSGMREVLVDLKNNGFFLGIATSRTKAELEELECLMDIIDIFDAVITSDMVNKPKPHPESLDYIIENFRLERDETIYIGDSVIDQKTAQKAYVYFGYAAWENKNEIKDYDYIFKTPQSIYKIYQ